MAAPRYYEIRLFDRPLVAFTLTDEALSLEITLDDYDNTAYHLMPCGLSLDAEGLWRWLESRSIPANRRNAARICHQLGFQLGNLEALYKTSLGLSLNDSYWVVPKSFPGRFADYNLFDNSFSEAIGALAVSGEVRGSSLAGNTPELTTDGTLRKGWRIVDGKRVLYKGASDGYAPGEPTSEYLAWLIARSLGLDAVRYGLDTWANEQCSTCENFASKDVSYVPFAVATGSTNLADVLRWCHALSSECFQSVCDMLVFDALICNTDRHLANFGILRDNVTGKPLKLAPLFDNGRGLFPNVAEDDHQQFMLEAHLHGPAFGGATFEELLQRIMGPRQLSLLQRAQARGIVGNVHAPAKRVAALDAFIRQQSADLQSIPTVDHEALVAALATSAPQRAPFEQGPFRL
ncbi:MAG: HipA domain-containing protein [Coriobacteriia bacterium]|nr:HipA domain-containing protein [Coriobacteriia bacterium]